MSVIAAGPHVPAARCGRASRGHAGPIISRLARNRGTLASRPTLACTRRSPDPGRLCCCCPPLVCGDATLKPRGRSAPVLLRARRFHSRPAPASSGRDNGSVMRGGAAAVTRPPSGGGGCPAYVSEEHRALSPRAGAKHGRSEGYVTL